MAKRLIGFMIAAVAATACKDEPRRPQGPVVVVELAVEPEPGEAFAVARDRALSGARERLDERGVELGIAKTDRGLELQVSGEPADADRLVAILTRQANLGFHWVDDTGTYGATLARAAAADPHAGLRSIAVKQDTWSAADGPTHQMAYLEADDRASIEQWLAGAAAADPALTVPSDRKLLFEQIAREPGGDPLARPRWRAYVVAATPLVTGDMIAKIEVTYDPQVNQPQVKVDFNADGSRRFAELTRNGVGRKLAIVMGDRVRMAPVVNGAITGGSVVVTMGAGTPEQLEREAHDLAALLRTARMPVVREISRRVIGAPPPG